MGSVSWPTAEFLPASVSSPGFPEAVQFDLADVFARPFDGFRLGRSSRLPALESQMKELYHRIMRMRFPRGMCPTLFAVGGKGLDRIP